MKVKYKFLKQRINKLRLRTKEPTLFILAVWSVFWKVNFQLFKIFLTMENLDKTMFTNNEDDLQKIYEEEANKLHANQFKIDILKKIVIEDFSNNLSETSRGNIEKALLAVRIRDHITMDNGQRILGNLNKF